VRTRLILSIQKEALLIPFSAVQMTESDPIVFIVKSDMTIDQRTVKLGQRADDLVVVSSGVQPNEQIVLEGQINLYQGAHVSIPEANR
jgi:multidrug efflux system membrane fusion protein